MRIEPLYPLSVQYSMYHNVYCILNIVQNVLFLFFCNPIRLFSAGFQGPTIFILINCSLSLSEMSLVHPWTFESFKLCCFCLLFPFVRVFALMFFFMSLFLLLSIFCEFFIYYFPKITVDIFSFSIANFCYFLFLL